MHRWLERTSKKNENMKDAVRQTDRHIFNSQKRDSVLQTDHFEGVLFTTDEGQTQVLASFFSVRVCLFCSDSKDRSDNLSEPREQPFRPSNGHKQGTWIHIPSRNCEVSFVLPCPSCSMNYGSGSDRSLPKNLWNRSKCSASTGAVSFPGR